MSYNVKFDFEKFVDHSISEIEGLKEEFAFTVVSENLPLTNSIATISYSNNQFNCKFYVNEIHGQEYFFDTDKFGFNQDLILDRTGFKWKLNKNGVICKTISLSSPQIIDTKLIDFYSGDQSFDETYVRLIIPTEKELELEMFESYTCKKGVTTTFCGLIEVDIDNRRYHLFTFKNKETRKNYLIIDSISLSNFDVFKKDTDAIILTIGFFTGDLLLDEYFYLSSKSVKFDTTKSIRYLLNKQSILTGAKLLNYFRFKEYLKTIEQEHLYGNYSNQVLSSVFNNMCQKLISNEVFSNVILLILEGNLTTYTTLKCGIYSIALETLTNIIYEENEDRINPVSDKELASSIREKMYAVINEHSNFLTSYGISVLKSKVNDINRPTNSKKLIKPFELFNLYLTDEDKEVLNHRNKFLHGTSPLIEGDSDKKDSESIYISLKMLVLINSLVLKYIGYEGHLKNFASLYRYNKNESLSEHLYKVI